MKNQNIKKTGQIKIFQSKDWEVDEKLVWVNFAHTTKQKRIEVKWIKSLKELEKTIELFAN